MAGLAMREEILDNRLETVEGEGGQRSNMWLSNSHPAEVPVAEVENILKTDKEVGLTRAQAEERYATFGFNELTAKEDEPVWKKYLEQCLEY